MLKKNANRDLFIQNKMLKYTKHACESKKRNYVYIQTYWQKWRFNHLKHPFFKKIIKKNYK